MVVEASLLPLAFRLLFPSRSILGKYHWVSSTLFSCFTSHAAFDINPPDVDYSWPAVWYFLIASTVFGCLLMLTKVMMLLYVICICGWSMTSWYSRVGYSYAALWRVTMNARTTTTTVLHFNHYYYNLCWCIGTLLLRL